MSHRNFQSVKRLLLFIGVIILLANCNKEKNEKDCWDFYYKATHATGTICDQTEHYMQVVYSIYDRASAPKYCWKAIYPTYMDYVENISDKVAGLIFSDAVSYEKVICGYCQAWECYYKYTKKPNPNGQNSFSFYQGLCGDTCLTLYPGRKVIIRETVDSIIYVVFSHKLPL